MVVQVAVLSNNDVSDSIVGVTHRDTALLQVNRDPVLLGVRGERFPHLAWTETRVMELLDQGRDILASQAEDRQDRLAEREVLDALGRPERADLRAGDAPDFLRVRAEERLVEAPPETCR